MEIVYILAENAVLGLVVAVGLFLFGSYRSPIPKIAGALLLLFFFLALVGLLRDNDPLLSRAEETGFALFLFFVPLGIVSSFLKTFRNRKDPKILTPPRIEPPVFKG